MNGHAGEAGRSNNDSDYEMFANCEYSVTNRAPRSHVHDALDSNPAAIA